MCPPNIADRPDPGALRRGSRVGSNRAERWSRVGGACSVARYGIVAGTDTRTMRK